MAWGGQETIPLDAWWDVWCLTEGEICLCFPVFSFCLFPGQCYDNYILFWYHFQSLDSDKSQLTCGWKSTWPLPPQFNLCLKIAMHWAHPPQTDRMDHQLMQASLVKISKMFYDFIQYLFQYQQNGKHNECDSMEECVYH